MNEPIFKPREISSERRSFKGTFGKSDWEETARMIVIASQQTGQWLTQFTFEQLCAHAGISCGSLRSSKLARNMAGLVRKKLLAYQGGIYSLTTEFILHCRYPRRYRASQKIRDTDIAGLRFLECDFPFNHLQSILAHESIEGDLEVRFTLNNDGKRGYTILKGRVANRAEKQDLLLHCMQE